MLVQIWLSPKTPIPSHTIATPSRHAPHSLGLCCSPDRARALLRQCFEAPASGHFAGHFAGRASLRVVPVPSVHCVADCWYSLCQLLLSLQLGDGAALGMDGPVMLHHLSSGQLALGLHVREVHARQCRTVDPHSWYH